MSTQSSLGTPPAAALGRRKKVSFGVSIEPEDAKRIDERICQIRLQSGVALSRSNYFELLARYDRTHHSIEQIFAEAPAGAAAA